MPEARAGSPAPTRFISAHVKAPQPRVFVVTAAASRKLAGDSSFMHPQPPPSFGPSHSLTISLGFGNGSGRSSTASATENVAVLAPTPRAVTSTTVVTKPRDRLIVRAA